MSALVVTKEPQVCSCPLVSSHPGQSWRSTCVRTKVIDHQICSEAEPPELVGKVVGVVGQEGAEVEIQQPFRQLCHNLPRAENQAVGLLG